jgi:hypothetical protein
VNERRQHAANSVNCFVPRQPFLLQALDCATAWAKASGDLVLHGRMNGGVSFDIWYFDASDLPRQPNTLMLVNAELLARVWCFVRVVERVEHFNEG